MPRNHNNLKHTIQAYINFLNFLFRNKPKFLLVKLTLQQHQIRLTHFLNQQ